MLEINDSVEFSRTSAAVSLALGALFFLAASLIEPAWAPDARAYLEEIASASNRYQASGVLTRSAPPRPCSAWSVSCICCADGGSPSASSVPGW